MSAKNLIKYFDRLHNKFCKSASNDWVDLDIEELSPALAEYVSELYVSAQPHHADPETSEELYSGQLVLVAPLDELDERGRSAVMKLLDEENPILPVSGSEDDQIFYLEGTKERFHAALVFIGTQNMLSRPVPETQPKIATALPVEIKPKRTNNVVSMAAFAVKPELLPA